MLYPRMVSVTFRSMECEEIVKLAKKAGLSSIEWGGDVHVPQGDTKKAKEAKKMTEDAGVTTAAYDSYFRVGCELIKYTSDRHMVPLERRTMHYAHAVVGHKYDYNT